MDSYLDLDVQHALQLRPVDLVGQRIAILGISGSGKTNTGAVLIEETLQQGIPLTIVDIEGEYWGLKERYDLLIVGRGAMVDLEIAPAQAAQIAEFSLRQRVTVILDLSEFKLNESFELLLNYFNRLWEIASLERKPYGIVLEEASEFIPQSGTTPLKNILKTIASRGRKKALALTVINQRATTLEKNVLTQASILFLHNVRYPTDLKVYEDLIPLKPSEMQTLVESLQPGQAVVIYRNDFKVVQMRVRHTYHAGATPGLDEAAAPQLHKLDERLIAQLKSALEDPAQQPDAKDQEIARLRHELGETEKRIAELSSRQPPAPRPAAPAPQARAQTTISNTQATRADARTNAAQQRGVERQVSAFQRVLSGVRTESRKDQLEALLFLNANEGKVISQEEIARCLGYNLEFLSKHPPHHLFKLGWLQRTRGDFSWDYRSHLTARLKEDYPNLDTAALVEQIHRLVK